VQGRDRGLRLVLPEPVTGQRGLEHGDALDDQVAPPEAAVLIGQRHEAAVGARPGRASRVVEQKQGQEPRDLRFVRRRFELPSQPDCLRGQVDVAAVPLVEHQIQHLQHGAQVSRLT